MREFRDLSLKKELRDMFLIYFLGGTAQALVFDFEDFGNFFDAFEAICISGLFWVVMWKGNEYLVLLIDSTGVRWVEQPLKRFFISFISSVVFILLAVVILNIVILTGFRGMAVKDVFNNLNPTIFITAMIITLTISTFLHGRAFLMEWRSAAVRIEQLKVENLSARYDALKNQVNPHFLFNSLNTLSSLVYDDQEKAVEFIRKLSQVYRYVLEKRDCELVTLKEELDFLNNYIFLQKIRFGENLMIELKKDVESGWVPPLAIQVLVENAIKHNVVCEEKPLRISIGIGEQGVKVSNNIQEKLDKDSTGVGLSNLKARYEYLTNEKVEVNTENNQFNVSLPLLKISDTKGDRA